jgi:hypothetical protein
VGQLRREAVPPRSSRGSRAFAGEACASPPSGPEQPRDRTTVALGALAPYPLDSMWPQDEWQGWWAWSEGRWFQWFYGKWWYWDYDQEKWIRWREPAPDTAPPAPLTEPRRSRSRSPPAPEPDAPADASEAALVRGLKRVRLSS